MKLFKVITEQKPVGVKVQHFMVKDDKELNNIKRGCEEGKLNKRILNYSIKEISPKNITDIWELRGMTPYDFELLMDYIKNERLSNQKQEE